MLYDTLTFLMIEILLHAPISKSFIQGFSKKILESRFAEIMGNFCYGTYIAHIAFCFTRGLLSYTLYPASRLVSNPSLSERCNFSETVFYNDVYW